MTPKRLTSTAGMVLASRIGGAVLGVAILMVLSKSLSPAQLGIFVAAQGCAILLATVGTLNMEALAIRIIPQNPAGSEPVQAYARAARQTALIGLPAAALLTALYVRITAQTAGPSIPGLLGLGAMVLAMACMRVAAQWATAKGAIATAAIWPMLVRPLLFLIALLILMKADAIDLSILFWVAALAYGLSALTPFLAVMRTRTEAATAQAADSLKLRREGLILLLATVFLDRFPDVVSVLAGAVLAEDQVAAIAISLRLALIVRMVTVSITMTLSPRVSRAVGQQDQAELLRLTDICTLSTSLASVSLVVMLGLFAKPVLSIFGQDYVAAATTLRVLSLVGLVPALFGPSLMVLVSSARSAATVRATLVASLMLIGASAVGAAYAGATGFAAGIVLGQAVWSLMLARAVYQQTGLFLPLPWALGRAWQRSRSEKTRST
ncbi:MAG: lipopolysaccharide biosynthesis protein [Parvularcula sp.]